MSTPTEPRTLLGWTVPEHFAITTTKDRVHHVTCRHVRHEGGFPGRIFSEDDEDDRGRAGRFLYSHAHGEVVEYRPEPRQEVTRVHLPADWRTLLHKVEHGAMDARSTAKTVALIESWIADTPPPVEALREPPPVPYAKYKRDLGEEIDRRDEAEDWADKLAAALAPPHVVGEHSLKNHPWRNALEWARQKPAVSASVTDAIEFVLVRFVEGEQSREVVRSILTDAFKGSPLPDSETVWGNWLPREQRVIVADDEAEARRVAHVEDWPVRQRRAAGPWIEVPSDHQLVEERSDASGDNG